ncbi:putative amidoligase enzyme [Catovirus CTV1]|uniref:Putative amidoligase enzyme n=1 Tax=Catovirus CTV1 TaxID=1977631 RepID=A0A1V0S9H8_9VIRU|nr:putative amidoligase enzyme [Catovirus CTV1]
MNIKTKNGNNPLFDIMKSTIFGIEIETCIKFEKKIRIPNALYDYDNFELNLSAYYNYLMDNKMIPVLTNFTNPLERYTFGVSMVDENKDIGKKWKIVKDNSIKCGDNPYIYPIEIVSPILRPTIILRNPLASTQQFKDLYEEEEGYFMEGFNNIYNYYYFLFNNEYSDINKIKIIKNDSQGFHVHISNEKITTPNKTSYISEEINHGLLHFSHYLRMFYFFEELLYDFVDESRKKSVYCKPLKADLHSTIYGDYLVNNIFLDMEKYFVNGNIKTSDVIDMYFTPEGNGKNRYYSINLTHINTDENVDYFNPIHFEIRMHQGTNDIAEMTNWTLLMILFYSTCIEEMDKVIKLFNEGDIENASKLYKDYLKPFDDDYLANNCLNLKMFNLFFDRFIRSNVLKNYYRNKARSSFLKNSPTPVPSNIIFHSPKKFDQNGKALVSPKLENYLKTINYPYEDTFPNYYKPIALDPNDVNGEESPFYSNQNNFDSFPVSPIGDNNDRLRAQFESLAQSLTDDLSPIPK